MKILGPVKFGIVSMAVFGFYSYALGHDGTGKEETPCSVAYRMLDSGSASGTAAATATLAAAAALTGGVVTNPYVQVDVSPSLQFIKSHFTIPADISFFDVPVFAELNNGMKVAGRIRVTSKGGNLQLHLIPIQKQIS